MHDHGFLKRPVRLTAWLAGVVAMLAVVAAMLTSDMSRAAAAGAALPISAAPLPLNREDPGADRIGALRFLGAVQIRSSNADFGGISGLRAGPDGRFLAVSDTGNWLTFRTLERDGRLIGIADAWLAPMIDSEGEPPRSKTGTDAEALEWDPMRGEAQVVFEQEHRIVTWRALDPARPETLAARALRTETLPAMADWPDNGGGEAMARFTAPDGTLARVIVSEERVLKEGGRLALLTHQGRTRSFGIEGVAEHSPTDAAMLDDRRMLLLQRRFNLKGAGAAVSLIDLSPLFSSSPAERLSVQLLARWEAPFTLDNMEGMAVAQESGQAFIYLISDDNLSSLQRTVLMKFALDLPEK
jgi:hypothetical protein